MSNTRTTRRRHTAGHAAACAADDRAGAEQEFTRALNIGAVYGLLAWLHLVLCLAFFFAGMLDDGRLDGDPTSTGVWAGVYVTTGLLMIVVAVGLVGGRPLAWQAAAWCVVPNLAAHIVLLPVLPWWGATAIACDLLVIGLVVGERRRRTVSRAVSRSPRTRDGRARGPRPASPLLGHRRPT